MSESQEQFFEGYEHLFSDDSEEIGNFELLLKSDNSDNVGQDQMEFDVEATETIEFSPYWDSDDGVEDYLLRAVEQVDAWENAGSNADPGNADTMPIAESVDATSNISGVLTTEPAAPNKHSKAPIFLNTTHEQQEQFIEEMKNKNTKRKTESVINTFATWLKSGPNFENRKAENIPPTELNNYVGSFVLSIRKHDGSEYEPDTLTSYHRGIDRYLREKNYGYSLVSSEEFRTSREVLASKRKELKQKGKGNKPNKCTPLTESDEQILKQKGILGCKSPRALQNSIWLSNTMHFGLRGCDENRKLKWGDIELCTDPQGKEYLEFNERDTKTRTGEHQFGHQRSFKPKQFSTENKAECPVEYYKLFKSQRPTNMCQPDSPFYLAINYKRKGNSKWYKSQAMGRNTLNNIMKEMSKRGSLSGKKTNHSARATAATRLLHAGVPPTTIVQLTGHKNVSSLNNYAVASIEQQREMSSILSCASTHEPSPSTPQHPIPSTSSESEHDSRLDIASVSHSETNPVRLETVTNSNALNNTSIVSTANNNTAGIFQGASFSNCTFNLNFGPPAPPCPL